MTLLNGEKIRKTIQLYENKQSEQLPAQTACLVGEGGFEPPKHDATDLQSAPFGHSGTPPYELVL